MNSWKEQLQKHFNESYEYILPQEAIDAGVQWYANFIFTEIIEKIVQDVESESRMTTNQMARHLRRKWL